MKKEHSAVLACVGAVIGAGFSSGREIVSFFTQYGVHGWWLIALAVLVMTALCALCMRMAQAADPNWISVVYGGKTAQLCSMILLVLTAGAMISAAGHMIALLWAHPWAYAAGVLGTLLAARRMGAGSLKPLNLVSAVLTLALLCALMASLVKLPTESVQLSPAVDWKTLAAAAVRAVGYAAMNMMLAIGVVCRSAGQARGIGITSGLFGWIIGMLLLVSQCVYSRYPSSGQTPFPMIALLADNGRKGYLFSVALLYLSVITTLASVLCALGTAVEVRTSRRELQWLLVLGLPLAVSGIGFEGIVDRFYAPAGLVCLVCVFAPMLWRLKKSKASFP